MLSKQKLEASVSSTYKPEIFNLQDQNDQKKLEILFKTGVIREVSNDYEEEQRELFAINNPTLVYTPGFEDNFKKYYDTLGATTPLWQNGRWVFFPWLSKLVHVLQETDFYRVRTARNRNLITEGEQEKFYNSTIGIAGLSVGSSVALAIALQGGGKNIKLADMDRLALSNTNRIITGIDNLGMLKVEMAARRIYEINPYANVEIFSKGLTKETIDDFFVGKKKIDIIIDEIDNLAIKYLIREHARKNRVAIVMAADNGDNAVVDVERYDLDPNTPFFHGRMGDVNFEMLAGLDKFGIGKMITKHVGPENVTERMQESLLEMGKTIVSWPQLGGAAMINGAAVAYCVRKILNGQQIEGNRALISLDEKLDPTYQTKESVERRQASAETFKKIFGL